MEMTQAFFLEMNRPLNGVIGALDPAVRDNSLSALRGEWPPTLDAKQTPEFRFILLPLQHNRLASKHLTSI
jgi:hypothetical protein